jgi:hypothetical protein
MAASGVRAIAPTAGGTASRARSMAALSAHRCPTEWAFGKSNVSKNGFERKVNEVSSQRKAAEELLVIGERLREH